MGLLACSRSSVDLGYFENVQPAKTLEEARQAVIIGQASLSDDFYRNAYENNPMNPEYAYFHAAITLAKEKKEMREFFEDLQPNHILRGLKKMQREVLPNQIQALEKVRGLLLTGLNTPFDPIDLGEARYPYTPPDMQGDHVILDRFDLVNMSSMLKMDLLFFQLLSGVNLEDVEVFDRELEKIRKDVYKKRPECKKSQSKAIPCVNEILDKGLNLVHTSNDPRIQKVFTISEETRKWVKTASLSLKEQLLLFLQLAKERSELPQGKRYFTIHPTSDDYDSGLNFIKCFLKKRRFPLFEKVEVLFDFPGFLNNLPSDLRVLMPRKMKYPKGGTEEGNLDDILDGIELLDSTLGGLFPNGDLLKKTKGQEEALVVVVYFYLITAWAQPAFD